MSDPVSATNEVIERESPALFASLSALGRRVAFPPDIPFQAAEARGKRFNATIGQITDGQGHPLIVPALDLLSPDLPAGDRDRAFLYSPIEGIAELRRLWRERQRRGVADSVPSTLPQVTVGLTHGLSIVADLFAGEGASVAVAQPFWGNYRQAFAVRTGAELLTAPAYEKGRWVPEATARALAAAPPDRPAVAIVNLPSNPGGYMPSGEERTRLVESLVAAAEERPLVVVCDDAYLGLVYEPEVPDRSLFWDLVGRHPRLVPIKIDGVTKELSFFGGRVGFLSFPFAPDSAIARALESKVKCLLRAALGSPVAVSQALAAAALRAPAIDRQLAEIRAVLAERYRVLAEAIARVDRDLLVPLPFNAGCFALLELTPELGLSAEDVRRHLLATQETGVVAIPPRFLRIAFCSVAVEALPELVTRLEAGVRDLASA